MPITTGTTTTPTTTQSTGATTTPTTTANENAIGRLEPLRREMGGLALNDNDNDDTPTPGSSSRVGGDSVVTTVRDGGLLEPTEIGSGSGATDRVGVPGVVPATTTITPTATVVPGIMNSITIGTILEDHRVHHQVPSCYWCGGECYTLQCPGCYMRFCDQCQWDGKLLGRDCMCRQPPGLEVDIAAVTVCTPCGPQTNRLPESNNSEWSLMSGSRWRAKKSAEEELMIHTLTDQTFTKVCIDSGAGKAFVLLTLFQVTTPIRLQRRDPLHCSRWPGVDQCRRKAAAFQVWR